jgi:hypothetical protein
MSSPSKAQSPIPKRLKGDDDDTAKDEDKELLQPAEAVTLEAIGCLFEEKLEIKLDQKLNPMNKLFNEMRGDLNTFKETVRKELSGIGLEIKTINSESAQSSAKLAQLEEEIRKLKLGHASISLPGRDQAERDITAVVGNIPKVTTFDDAKAWIHTHWQEHGLPSL